MDYKIWDIYVFEQSKEILEKNKTSLDLNVAEDLIKNIHEDYKNDLHQVAAIRIQNLTLLIKNSSITEGYDNKTVNALITLFQKYELANILMQYLNYETYEMCDPDILLVEQIFDQTIHFIYQISKIPKIIENFLSGGRLFPILFKFFFNPQNIFEEDVCEILLRCLINLSEDESGKENPFQCISEYELFDLFCLLRQRGIPDVLSAQFFYVIERHCEPCFFNERNIQQYFDFFITRITSNTIYFITGFVGVMIEKDSGYGFGMKLPQIQNFAFRLIGYYQSNGADSYKTIGSLAKLVFTMMVNSNDEIIDITWKKCNIISLIQAIIDRCPYVKDTAFNLLRIIAKHKYLVEKIEKNFPNLAELFSSCFETDRVIEQESALRFIKSYVTRNENAMIALTNTEFLPWINTILLTGNLSMQRSATKLLSYIFDFYNKYRKEEITGFISYMESEEINERFDEILESDNELLISIITRMSNCINQILGD